MVVVVAVRFVAAVALGLVAQARLAVAMLGAWESGAQGDVIGAVIGLALAAPVVLMKEIGTLAGAGARGRRRATWFRRARSLVTDESVYRIQIEGRQGCSGGRIPRGMMRKMGSREMNGGRGWHSRSSGHTTTTYGIGYQLLRGLVTAGTGGEVTWRWR